MKHQGWIRLGLLLVIAGLAVQAAAAFFWSPGAFIVSAALGAPAVVVGALVALTVLARMPKGGATETVPGERQEGRQGLG